MTDITKNITNHYQELVSGELEKIHVPEWKMDVYYKKTNPFAVEAKVINLQAQGKIVDALVESIVQKARDKDGKRLFSDAHRHTLMNEADPNVVTRIATQINNAGVVMNQEAARKE